VALVTYRWYPGTRRRADSAGARRCCYPRGSRCPPEVDDLPQNQRKFSRHEQRRARAVHIIRVTYVINESEGNAAASLFVPTLSASYRPVVAAAARPPTPPHQNLAPHNRRHCPMERGQFSGLSRSLELHAPPCRAIASRNGLYNNPLPCRNNSGRVQKEKEEKRGKSGGHNNDEDERTARKNGPKERPANFSAYPSDSVSALRNALPNLLPSYSSARFPSSPLSSLLIITTR
jgi:hypothetical protein